MNEIPWYDSLQDLPEDGQRILYFRPAKLTKIGEMVYFESKKEWFIEVNPFWSDEILKPEYEIMEED